MPRLILCLAFAIAACAQNEPEPTTTDNSADAGTASLSTPAVDGPAGTSFDVPSDANARYFLLRVEKGEGGNIIATTRREGSSGTSFARREIDCDAQTFRYVGEGDTLAAAQQPAPNPGEMSDLVDGSISGVAAKFACANK